MVIASRGAEAGQKMAEQLGAAAGQALYVSTDVRSSASIRAMIQSTVERFGKLDILVNNAGYHLSKNVEQTSEEEWEFIIGTNLRSTFLCSKYAIPHLRTPRARSSTSAAWSGWWVSPMPAPTRPAREARSP